MCGRTRRIRLIFPSPSSDPSGELALVCSGLSLATVTATGRSGLTSAADGLLLVAIIPESEAPRRRLASSAPSEEVAVRPAECRRHPWGERERVRPATARLVLCGGAALGRRVWGVRWGGRTAMPRAALARERPPGRTRRAGRGRGAYGGAPRRRLIPMRTMRQALRVRVSRGRRRCGRLLNSADVA